MSSPPSATSQEFSNNRELVIEPRFEALDESHRSAVEADFEQVNELAYVKGVETIIEETTFHSLN